MAKKKNCRRTVDENKIHSKAVKMRKMTDDQLVHYVEDRVPKARSEGFNEAKKEKSTQLDVDQLMKEIEAIKGIGKKKADDIKVVISRTVKAVSNG